MLLGFIMFGCLAAGTNAFFILKFKKSIVYAVLMTVINVLFVTLNILARCYNAESFFDIISLNFLMFFSVYDMLDREIPALSLYIYCGIGAVAAFFVRDTSFVLLYIYAVVVFLVLFLTTKKGKKGMGLADVLAISAISLYNATYNTTSIVIFSMLFSFLFGIICAIKNKSGMKTQIPYLPFLFLSNCMIEILYRIPR